MDPCLTGEMAVLPLQTERSALRMMRMNDTPLAAYRDLPEITRYQSWPLPFTNRRCPADVGGRGRPRRSTSEGLGSDSRSTISARSSVIFRQSIGGSVRCRDRLHPRPRAPRQGIRQRGRRPEMIDALFTRTEDAPHRRFDRPGERRASISPSSTPRLPPTRAPPPPAELVRGQWVEDMRFGLLRDTAPIGHFVRHRAEPSNSIEITADNLRPRSPWRHYDTRNRSSPRWHARWRAALVPPEYHNDHRGVPWIRAVQADDEIVGFMMLSAASPPASRCHICGDS